MVWEKFILFVLLCGFENYKNNMFKNNVLVDNFNKMYWFMKLFDYYYVWFVVDFVWYNKEYLIWISKNLDKKYIDIYWEKCYI